MRQHRALCWGKSSQVNKDMSYQSSFKLSCSWLVMFLHFKLSMNNMSSFFLPSNFPIELCREISGGKKWLVCAYVGSSEAAESWFGYSDPCSLGLIWPRRELPQTNSKMSAVTAKSSEIC